MKIEYKINNENSEYFDEVIRRLFFVEYAKKRINYYR